MVSSSWMNNKLGAMRSLGRPLTFTFYATLLIIFLGLSISSFYLLLSISSCTSQSSEYLYKDHAPTFPNRTKMKGGPVVVPSSSLPLIWSKPIWEVPPPGSKMPPLENFKLSQELVKQRAKDNIIIVTFGNYAFLDFILNWAKHLTHLGLTNLLVGAMDTQLLRSLYRKGVPVFNMNSHMDKVDVGWGSAKFHKMGRDKISLIHQMLPLGFEILMCDSDVVWLKNPLPYFARFPGADILTSTDQFVPTVTDDRLEVWEKVSSDCNIGLFYWRPTDSAKKLTQKWIDMLLVDDKLWDQIAFNKLLKNKFGPSVGNESGLVYAFDGTLKLGLLPVSIFCSGHTFFVQETYQRLKLEAYAVHTTFQLGGIDGKRHRLREAKIFYDEPEYYDSPGGFLSFKSSIPKSLFLDGEHNLESHFSLINYQMKQIRTGLAIASVLNRTLVMPPLWCRLDRLWFPHPGVLPGTMTRQPFLCPLDHVFEVSVMLREELEEDGFGPKIDFREYSFLDNPLLPKEIKESWLDVQLCKQGSQGCRISNQTNEQGVLKIPELSIDETLKEVFSSFKNIKVIQFSSMEDAFGGFSDKVKEKRFRNRVKRYVGEWCCLENHEPGQIYYDMYWDEKPLPPPTPKEDHPPWQ